MLLFSYTVKRYAWVFPAVFLASAVITLLWVPQPAIVPFPRNGFISNLEIILPMLIALPLSFLLHDKSSIELALVHGLDTLTLFGMHVLSVLFWMTTAFGAVVSCYRVEALTDEQQAALALPLILPQTLRFHIFLSVVVSALFFASLVVFLRVLMKNCFVPIFGVLLTFTLFYERSRALRMSGIRALKGALFDPYISTYVLGDTVPLQYGYGYLWSANRLLFFNISLILLVATALILRRERMHE